jgi:hypothetical protein
VWLLQRVWVLGLPGLLLQGQAKLLLVLQLLLLWPDLLLQVMHWLLWRPGLLLQQWLTRWPQVLLLVLLCDGGDCCAGAGHT